MLPSTAVEVWGRAGTNAVSQDNTSTYSVHGWKTLERPRGVKVTNAEYFWEATIACGKIYLAVTAAG